MYWARIWEYCFLLDHGRKNKPTHLMCTLMVTVSDYNVLSISQWKKYFRLSDI